MRNEISQPENNLPVHEWMAIVVIIGLLLGLSIVSLFSEPSANLTSETPPHFIIEQEIEVVVQGAVQNPGVYKLKRGALLKDVIVQAIPLPDADLNKLKANKKVRKGQIINVPKKKEKKSRSYKAKEKRFQDRGMIRVLE